MHIDPLAHLPDVDEDALTRAVPVSGSRLLKLLLGDWRNGSIGESEYFQATVLVWLTLGPILLVLGLLFLTSLVDPRHPISLAIMAAIAVLFIAVTANLSAKRARGKGLPAWIGPATSLIGWLLLPIHKGTAVSLIGLGPIFCGFVLKRLAKKAH
jgi:hypothetical protein